MPSARSPGSTAAVISLYVTLLSGRFRIDGFDVRIALFAATTIVVVAWIAVERPPMRTSGLRGRTPLLFAYVVWLLTSAIWSPEGSDTIGGAVDVAFLGIAILLALTVATRADQASLSLLPTLFYATGALYLLGAIAQGPGDQGRYSAFGGGPNVFVRVMVLAALAAALRMLMTRESRHMAAAAAFLMGAVLSGSRGGLVSVSLLLFVAWLARRYILRRRVAVRAIVGLSVVVIAVIRWAPGAIDFASRRFFQQTIEQRYTSSRDQIFDASLQIFRDHPFFGSGLDGFVGLVGRFNGWTYPHNVFVASAAEAGILGISLVTGALIQLWRPLLRKGRHSAVSAFLAAGSLYLLGASMFSGDYYDTRFMWVMLIFSIRLLVVRRIQQPIPNVPQIAAATKERTGPLSEGKEIASASPSTHHRAQTRARAETFWAAPNSSPRSRLIPSESTTVVPPAATDISAPPRDTDGSSMTFASGLASRLVALALFAMYTLGSARLLDADSRGRMALATQTGYLISAFALAGWERPVLAGLRSFSARTKSTLVAALVAVFSAAIGFVYRGPSAGFVVLCTLSMTISLTLTRLVAAQAVFYRRWRVLLLTQLSAPLALAGAFLILVSIGSESYRIWSSAFVAANVFPLVALLLPTAVDNAAGTDSKRSRGVRALAVGDIGVAVTQRSDRVLLGSMGMNSQLGTYSIISALTEIAVAPVVMLSQLMARRDSSSSRRILIFGLVTSAAALVSIAIFGPWLMQRALGETYRTSHATWILLSAAASFIALSRVLAARLLNSAATEAVGRTDAIMGVLAVTFYALLIPKFGGEGAATATLLAYASATATFLALTVRSSRGRTSKPVADL